MSNNIPVNGWPQLKDLEAVQPILNRLDKIEAWKRTVKEETFTGDDITIENALALPARSLITFINAIQDLHGYDHPWAGGAGKNLFDKDATGIVNNAAIASDGTTTPYNNWSVSDYIPVDEATDYAYSNVGISDTSSAVCAFYDSSKAHISNSAQTGATRVYTTPANTAFVRFEFYTSASNTMMFEKGSTASTYEPYSNICPISGRDSVVITRSDGDEISEDFTIQLGTTIYGADINWDTGVMTVKTTKGDMGSLTYTAQGRSDDGIGYLYSAFPTGALANGECSSSAFAYTSYVTVAARWEALTTGHLSIIGNGRLMVCGTETTPEAFKAAVTGQDLEYELATPTTIQLTPTQLQMLKGYNRVTLSDGYGTIELKALTGANWS